MKNGLVLHSDGSTCSYAGASTLNGYSTVQAENVDHVISLVKDHPYLCQGNSEFSIEIFESPSSRALSLR